MNKASLDEPLNEPFDEPLNKPFDEVSVDKKVVAASLANEPLNEKSEAIGATFLLEKAGATFFSATSKAEAGATFFSATITFFSY